MLELDSDPQRSSPGADCVACSCTAAVVVGLDPAPGAASVEVVAVAVAVEPSAGACLRRKSREYW